MRPGFVINKISAIAVAALIATSPGAALAATFDTPFSVPKRQSPESLGAPLAGEGLTQTQKRELVAIAQAFDASNFAVSEMLSRRLLDDAPEQPDVWYLLGLTLANMDRMDEAVDALGKAAGFYVQNAAPLVVQGDILKSLDRIDEARDAYVSALRRDPSNWLAYESLAILAEERGDTNDAIDFYRKAVSKSSNTRLFPRYNLAELYLVSGRAAEAVEVLTGYVDAVPDDVVALSALAQSQAAADMPLAAADTYEKAIRRAPNAPQLVLRLAEAQRQAGKFDDALETLQNGRDRFPEVAAMHVSLGSMLGAVGRYDTAADVFEKGLNRFPDDPRMVRGLSTVYARLGRLSDAIPLARQLTARDGRTAGDQLWLGMLHEQAEQGAQAAQAYEAALNIDPANWVAANNLAAVLTETDPARAVDLAKRAVDGSGGVATVRDTLAWAYLAAGQSDKAVEEYAAIVQAEPENAPVAYRYGRALLETGARDQGRAELQRALDLDPQFDNAATARSLLAAD